MDEELKLFSLGHLFILKALSRTQWATKVKKLWGFSETASLKS